MIHLHVRKQVREKNRPLSATRVKRGLEVRLIEEPAICGVALGKADGDSVPVASSAAMRARRSRAVEWNSCVTEIYLQFECAHHGWYPNAPAVLRIAPGIVAYREKRTRIQ